MRWTLNLDLSTRRSSTHLLSIVRSQRDYSFRSSPHNLIQIQAGTFYHQHPSSASGSNKSANPPYFTDLSFSIPSTPSSQIGQPSRKDQHWAVIGANYTATFLEVLRGDLLCIPPKARTYPYLSSDEIASKDPTLSLPSRAIQYVGFNSKNAGTGSAATGIRGAYLSARYESRREETDWTVLQYLKGDTELNPDRVLHHTLEDSDALLKQVIQDLQLEKLLDMPVSNLSNGQTRRSRIAKALLSRPAMLLLDEPFMGLDPPTLVRLSPMLKGLAWRSNPLLFLALRPQDPVPDWITHLVILGENRNITLMGTKAEVLFRLRRWADLYQRGGLDVHGEKWLRMMDELCGKPLAGVGDSLTDGGIQSYTIYDKAKEQEKKFFDGSLMRPRAVKWERQKLMEFLIRKPTTERTIEDWFTLVASVPSDLEADILADVNTKNQVLQSQVGEQASSSPPKVVSPSLQEQGEPLIEVEDLVLKYGTKTVLGHPPPQAGHTQPGLNLTIRRGTRVALLGPNGSGKTTLLSLFTSDHPQSYSLPMKFFGRARLPSKGKPGLSLWEIQKQIGHSSPEVHAFFPKRMTIRQTLESSWAEAFSSRPEITPERSATVTAVLQWWESELKQSSNVYQSSIWRGGTANGDDEAESQSHERSSSESVEWATSQTHTFATLPFSTQRLLLLLRALIKKPAIVILDEAFSGLSPNVRDKAMEFLHHGIPSSSLSSPSSASSLLKGLTNDQALIVVSHIREEIPDCVNEWIRLPSEEEATEHGKGVETGLISVRGSNENSDDAFAKDAGGIKSAKGWNQVWGL